jgi:anaphase-promoting complex subunit 2
MKGFWTVCSACWAPQCRFADKTQYIHAILTNLGSLPLDRIQGSLKLVPNYDYTLQQLEVFMNGARQEGLVNMTGGLWMLVKEGA